MTIDDLNSHLFETIEMLKNNSDPKASKNEKIDIDAAKTIADIGRVIVDGFKTQVNAIGIIAKSQNPMATNGVISAAGILPASTSSNVEH